MNPNKKGQDTERVQNVKNILKNADSFLEEDRKLRHKMSEQFEPMTRLTDKDLRFRLR